MKLYATWGGLIALVSALSSLVLFIAGYQTTKLAAGQNLAWIAVAIGVFLLFKGTQAARDARPNQAISFGGAYGAAMLISLFAALFGAIYIFIHFQFINTDFASYFTDTMRTNLEAKNMPDDQVEKTVSMMSFMAKPVMQAISAFFGQLIIGAVLGLIVAAIVKTPAARSTPDDAVAV